MNLTPSTFECGLLALELYLPRPFIDQSEYELAKGVPSGKITQGLGQTWMSFVSELEDVNSMGLTVLKNLLQRCDLKPEQIGKLEFATETLHDKSKSSKTILMQLLDQNKDVEGVTNLNACYGGTAALFNCIAWLRTEAQGRLAVVVMSDVAVYDTLAAQPTGGAGALAMLLGPVPGLVLEPLRASYFADAYDFYKPHLEREYPTVDGPLSTKVYTEALLSTYSSLKQKTELEGGQKSLGLEDFDYFCFHCPFTKQVEKAFLRLFYSEIMQERYHFADPTLAKKLTEGRLGFDEPVTQRILRDGLKKEMSEKLAPSLILQRKIGNIYTGSLYVSLMSLIYALPEESLRGKRVFMYSYGSGLAATTFSLRFARDFSKAKVLGLSSFENQLKTRLKVDIAAFDRLNLSRQEQYNQFGFSNSPRHEHLRPESFYLAAVDPQGRRKYQVFTAYNDRLASVAKSFGAPRQPDRPFRKLEIWERHAFIQKETGVSLSGDLMNDPLSLKTANLMVENCIGTLKVPLGLGMNFVINKRRILIPMATEEPSVIAGACAAAKLIGSNSAGFSASASKNIIRGQIFLENILTARDLDKILLESKHEIINFANENLCVSIVQKGGGVVDVQLVRFSPQRAVVNVLVDVQSSMGANTINTILEGLKPKIRSLFNAEILMCIVSNLCPERVAKASFRIPVGCLGTRDRDGREVARRVIAANHAAIEDVFRACTHNKGIMNGVEAVCLAVGQDTRAVEASCHAYSIYKYGKYRALTEYYFTNDGEFLAGEIELPFLVGTFGGATNSNKIYRANLRIMDSPSSSELGCILAAVGLAQNFAALRALTGEGIQRGHMRLHAHNIAMSAGVEPENVQAAVDYMTARNSISLETATEFLNSLKKGKA